MDQSIFKMLEGYGVTPEQAPYVIGLGVFILLFLLMKIIAGMANGGRDKTLDSNPWVVGDGQQQQPAEQRNLPMVDGKVIGAGSAASSDPNAPKPMDMAKTAAKLLWAGRNGSLDAGGLDTLMKIMADSGVTLTPAQQAEFDKMREKVLSGDGSAKGNFSFTTSSTSFSSGSFGGAGAGKLTFTYRASGAEPQTYVLEGEQVAHAKQMMKDGSPLDTICRDLTKDYDQWEPREQEAFQKAIKMLVKSGGLLK